MRRAGGPCGRERAGCASRTPVLQHPIPRPQTWPHQSEQQQTSIFAPSQVQCSQGKVAWCQLNHPANPHPPLPSRLCSVLAPGQEGGWPRSTRTGRRGGHKGKPIVARANAERNHCVHVDARSRFSRWNHKVIREHGRWRGRAQAFQISQTFNATTAIVPAVNVLGHRGGTYEGSDLSRGCQFGAAL